MKKLISIFLVAVMLLAMVPAMAITGSAATTRDTNWYNEESTEFVLTDAGDLLGFSDLLAAGTTFEGKTVKLGANITMNDGWDATTGVAPTDGDLWAAVSEKAFNGTFDGQGYTVSGLCLVDVGWNAGILGGGPATGKSATVKNVAIVNSCVVGANKGNVGTLFGLPKGTVTIENVYCSAYVKVTRSSLANVGGLIGCANNTECNITNCVFDGKLDGAGYGFGGMVGLANIDKTATNKNSVFNIENCAFYGEITAKYSIGGMVGTTSTESTLESVTVNIINCLSGGTITATDSTGSTGVYCGVVNEKATVNTDNNGNSTSKDALPAGFTSMPTGNPMPISIANMVWAISDTAMSSTEYHAYQKNAANDSIRLVGLVTVEDPATFSAVGYDIEMILGNGNTWTNKDEGVAPKITSVYTSVTETGKSSPTSAADLDANYIFVATVSGISTSYTGDITFVVKTFHDDAQGVRTYDDIIVINYQTEA